MFSLPVQHLAAARELCSAREIKKLNHIDVEGGSDPGEHEHRRISHAPLDPTDVTPVEAAVGCEVLLRYIALVAKPPQIPADALADVHR